MVAKLRPLNRRELEKQLEPMLDAHGHALLVVPSLDKHVAEWVDKQGGRVTGIGYRCDPRTVNTPALPRLPLFKLQPTDSRQQPM
jgi:hypothetical protein